MYVYLGRKSFLGVFLGAYARSMSSTVDLREREKENCRRVSNDVRLQPVVLDMIRPSRQFAH
jgi:hypothetical protein